MINNLLKPLTYRQSFSVESSFTLSDSISLLTKYVKSSSISAGLNDSLIGKVSECQVVIWHYHRRGLGQSGVTPAFEGSFSEQNGKATLKGEFKLQKSSKYMFACTLIGIFVLWAWIASRELSIASPISDMILFLIIGPILCTAFMVIYLHFGWRNDYKDIAYLQEAIGNILTKGSI